MNASTVLVWENRLTRLAVALLVVATAYGVFAGATVAMYYDVVPNMNALEDNLGAPQFTLYLLAVLVSFIHLPLALADAKHLLWKQATIRLMAAVGPLVVFLGTEGLIAHLLWWSPLSDTDRFHILHHTLFASVPLTLGYWLLLRWVWQPASFTSLTTLPFKVWLVSAVILVWVVMGFGILMGLVSPLVFGVTTLASLLMLPMIGRWRAKTR